MSRALIGYTGFVGSNIHRQAQFDELYNSKNIDDVVGKTFDLVVCAGVPAVKWWANQNPEEDLAIIKDLAERLKSIKAKHFVLISTVDVYPTPVGVDENSEIQLEEVCPYGRHRFFLEKELDGCFENFYIVRLPGLFGTGLKKNILFDMLCENILEKINLDSSFQWYPLSRIWHDIQTVMDENLSLVNFAVEPVQSREIKKRFFPDLDVGSAPVLKAAYDMQTVYADQFGKSDSPYLMSSEEVLNEMAEWLKSPEVNCG